MSAMLRAEGLKLATTRTFVALVAAAVALSLVIVVLAASLGEQLTEEDARTLATLDTSAFFVLLLAIIGMAGEWRHRTITSTFLAAPDRLRLVLAKLLAYAAAGVVLSLVVSVAVMAVSTVILSARDQPTLGAGELLDVLWRNLLIAALFGALGVAIGALIRNQVVALVVVLLTFFVVEPTLLGLAPDVARFGPLIGAPAGIATTTDAELDELLPPGLAVLVLLGWVAALSAAAIALLRARDLT